MKVKETILHTRVHLSPQHRSYHPFPAAQWRIQGFACDSFQPAEITDCSIRDDRFPPNTIGKVTHPPTAYSSSARPRVFALPGDNTTRN